MARTTISDLQAELEKAERERDDLRRRNAELEAVLKVVRVALEQAAPESAYREPT